MRQARFRVSLNKASTQTVTVAYTTVDGTAVAPSDYTAKSGTLTFAPGETSRDILISVRDHLPNTDTEEFTVVLSNPTNATLHSTARVGKAVLDGEVHEYVARFNWMYDNLHNNANGYFGPQTGPNAFKLPRHIAARDSNIINEAPDAGGQSVSETASFWVGLEAWNGFINKDWAPYNNCWNVIEQFYVPSTSQQPFGGYNPDHPADFIPEGRLPSDYPRLADITAPVGVDPLANELADTYGTDSVYLMHWIIDVEGDYGYKNRDGSKQIVYINTYQRGQQESSFETVTQPAWDDFNNGGGQYGFQPLFTQGLPTYPAAPFEYAKKWSYTNAPDAEARALQWAYAAHQFAAENGGSAAIAASSNKAKKMGDYLRYNLFDKYFREIGNSGAGATWSGPYKSCHYLINWYASWGGDAASPTPTWHFRIGCSEAHQGYQAPDVAYFMATGGGGFTPNSASAGDIWLGSLYRQLEMIRWLQSPVGPIAGGVTNSWNAAYEPVTDGRQNARFYGMYYTYAPVWHDPPSNNWVGFQAWGQGRTANLFLEVSDKTSPLAVEVRKNTEIILDRLVAWFLSESELTSDGLFMLPSTLSWVSNTPISGQTTTAANNEGVYEYIPSLNWPGTGTPDYTTFWNESSVPNPNLKCTVASRAADLGVAASLSYLLIAYAKGKQKMGKFTDPIPNSTFTAEDAFVFAKELLDRVWNKCRDDMGVVVEEPRTDYNRIDDPVYVPPGFSGTMPNGDSITPGATFISLRTFLKDDPKWPEVEAYLNGTGPAPVFTYHRFWAQAEYAISTAAMYRHFKDLL